MPKICLIIPCYNESKRLRKEAFLKFLNEYDWVDFCFVNDGSTDNTQQLLKELNAAAASRVCIVNIDKNSGKANAVWEGIKYVLQMNKYSIVGYWDADLSTPLSELPKMAHCFHTDTVHGIIGSRVKRMGAVIEREPMRHFWGRVFSTFSNWILKFPVYDSQCGAKLFRTQLAEKIFNKKFVTKWLFDVELLIRCRNEFGTRECSKMITEFPLVEWRDTKGSKLKLKDYLRVPLDLIKIHFHYNF